MREDTRLRLDRALRIERFKKIALGFAGVAAIGLVFALENLDLQVENAVLAGTVTGLDPLQAKTNAANGETVHVRLTDGRTVDVLALKSRNLHAGDPIEVTEHRHATGRVTHSLK